jgi:riboflavin kinase/FMN adenylyltransferase
VKLLHDLESLPSRFRRGTVSIGNFDGVHVGHAQIVRRLVAKAGLLDGAAVVFTFDPSPSQVLRPDRAPPMLCPTDRKVELLAEFGVDAVIVFPPTEAFLELAPQEFFERVVLGQLDAQALVEGPNFFFGRGRRGNVDVLRQFCDRFGVGLEVVEPVEVERQIVSSSRVRNLLAQGQVDQARRMLGRPYKIQGAVVHGAGRGMDLGYPTANIGGVETILPGEGIYAGRAFVDGRNWPAALSVGPNPTFDEDYPKIEAHLVDYTGQLYDREIEIDFLARLREIVRFDSVGDLVAQMDRDVANTQNIVAQFEDSFRVD